MIGARLIVWISSVGIDRHDRRIVSEQVLAAKRFHEPLLNFMFGGSTVARPPSNFLEGRRHDRIHAVARRKMSLDLLFAPGSFKLRHQVSGADYILSQSTQ